VCHPKTKICSFEFELHSGLESRASVPSEKKEMQLKIRFVQYTSVVCQCATLKQRDVVLNLSCSIYLNLVPVCHPKTKRYSFEFVQYSGLESCASVPPKNKEMHF
jgi:hypothetical protein